MHLVRFSVCLALADENLEISVFHLAPLDRYYQMETNRFSQVSGKPPVHMPSSQTPVKSCHLAITVFGYCLPLESTRRLSHWCFRGSITRPMYSLSTLRHRELPLCHARLASGCWLGFAGWDWLPARFHYKVSEFKITSFPLSRLCLAQDTVPQQIRQSFHLFLSFFYPNIRTPAPKGIFLLWIAA